MDSRLRGNDRLSGFGAPRLRGDKLCGNDIFIHPFQVFVIILLMGGFAYFGRAFTGLARLPWSALMHSMTFRAVGFFLIPFGPVRC
jgi:hypothetical protein